MLNTTHVTLPRGEIVEVQNGTLDETWFIKHGKTGYLNPEILAPYPEQPRRYIDPEKLKQLTTNVANNGVREPLVITPLTASPWIKIAEEHVTRPFVIVSGHRRYNASIDAKLLAVPVEVRIYASLKDFLSDAEILNGNRENLSEIEEGYELQTRLDNGDKITHIVAETGKSYQHLMGRIALTKLSPKIQALLSPELDKRSRLAIGLASALGSIAGLSAEDLLLELERFGDNETDLDILSEDEYRFCSQELHLKYIQRKGWKGVDAEKWLRTGEEPTKKSGNTHGPKTEAYVAKLTTRQRMLEWCKSVKGADFMEMTPKELRATFEYALPEDLEHMAEMLTHASQEIEGMAALLRKIASEKPRTSQTVLALSKRSEQRIVG